MFLLIILIITEILTPIVLRQHLPVISKTVYFISLIIHIILSLWIWILFLYISSFKGFYDAPQNVWMIMNMNGMIAAVVIPRLLLDILHFTGKFIKRKSGGYIKALTITGLVIFISIFSIIAAGTLIGRFNFKTEEITVGIEGLNPDLDGLKIVQISDLHLSGFSHHRKLLENVIDEINTFKPDIIFNTGDFVSFGWREFNGFDSILSKAISRYGNFAILGNHDFGTYHPYFTEADRDNNVLLMDKMVRSSGYNVLNDASTKLRIGKATIGIIGVTTKGRFPDIIHGDLGNAMKGLDSTDIKILLSHDPNHWSLAVSGKTDIDLTLSGHTHGMQMGIITKKVRWSPSKHFYPHWNGLYQEGQQFHYVNRGLGVLAIPFRIWMPPEITRIVLKRI